MVDLLFYIFASLMLFSALAVVFNKNAVNSAMCMIVTLVATAALFILLEAYFLAVLQVLVYAGAVMVLFLFIIMLLDVDKSEALGLSKRKIVTFARFAGIALLFFLVFSSFAPEHLPKTDLLTLSELEGNNLTDFKNTAKSFGQILFTKFMLPFQVIGFLLLTAMIGVIVISKKQKLPSQNA